jgi:hypothetical protein
MLCQARCNAYIVGKLCKDWRLVYNIIGLRVIANSLLVRSLIWVASRSPCAWSQSIICNLRRAQFNVVVADIRVASVKYSFLLFPRTRRTNLIEINFMHQRQSQSLLPVENHRWSPDWIFAAGWRRFAVLKVQCIAHGRVSCIAHIAAPL